MQVIRNESVVCFDVDDTLVMWNHVGTALKIPVECPYDGSSFDLTPHESHIKLLKNHKARGHIVVVWSQSGYAWAESVIKTLGLSEYVDFIMTKPRTYVDDLPVQEWLQDRVYIEPTSGWGRDATR
jgi:phosphoserine phosphatase